MINPIRMRKSSLKTVYGALSEGAPSTIVQSATWNLSELVNEHAIKVHGIFLGEHIFAGKRISNTNITRTFGKL
jgi:hypothetical protein